MYDTIPADVLGKLRQEVADWKKTEAYQWGVVPRDGVLARFQPLFAPEYVSQITAEEFRPFLLDKNNHHWSGLHRSGSKMCADMPKLRTALTLLVDETQPLVDRLDKAMGMVDGLGRNIATAILMVEYPDRYGVWNNQSEAKMKELGIWPGFDRGEPFGSRYVKVNRILVQLRDALGIDLWTLDYLWWHLDGRPPNPPPSTEIIDERKVVFPPEETECNYTFGLERHLHEFLRDNWDHTELGQEWALYEEDGEQSGYEFRCDIGRIDLLAKHRKKSQFLVIELKRNQTSDQTVGQLLRYMGWVKQHLVKNGEQVRGLIICHESDAALHYALSTVENVEVRLYQVEFNLKKPETLQDIVRKEDA